jgi:hypothetical protein
MNLKKKAIGLSLIALSAFGTLKAQTSNDNLLAFNDKANPKTEVKAENNKLTAPVIKSGTSSFDAAKASRNGNVSIIVAHGKNDPISGERYAKGFANGFASADKTGNKPIYITAVHREVNGDASTYVEIFIDGKLWDYKDHAQLSPKDAGYLLPTIMNEYVKEHGHGKILPVDVKPVLIATRN